MRGCLRVTALMGFGSQPWMSSGTRATEPAATARHPRRTHMVGAPERGGDQPAQTRL